MPDNEETDNGKDVVVPVVSEELHADAVPVVTGGVRVTKQVHTHDEVLEQELRKSHVEVKRVKTNRVVDGPQPVRRNGNVLIIPVVAEVLRVEKQWVVTEEIHITQTETRETTHQTVPVSHEEALVERVDEAGRPIETVEPAADQVAKTTRGGPAPILERSQAAGASSSTGGRLRSIVRREPGNHSR